MLPHGGFGRKGGEFRISPLISKLYNTPLYILWCFFGCRRQPESLPCLGAPFPKPFQLGHLHIPNWFLVGNMAGNYTRIIFPDSLLRTIKIHSSKKDGLWLNQTAIQMIL